MKKENKHAFYEKLVYRHEALRLHYEGKIMPEPVKAILLNLSKTIKEIHPSLAVHPIGLDAVRIYFRNNKKERNSILFRLLVEWSKECEQTLKCVEESVKYAATIYDRYPPIVEKKKASARKVSKNKRIQQNAIKTLKDGRNR